MSDNSKNTTKYALIAGGALVAAGAALYFLRGSRDEEVEPKLVSKKPAATRPAAPAAAADVPAVSGAGVAATAPQPALHRETTTALVNEYSFDTDSAATRSTEKPKVYQPPVADANGNIYFDSVGVRIQAARGWTITEETSPMPNVAMLSFGKAEYAERNMTGMPGEIPVVLLSIEDISNECISVDEFRQKSKTMAMAQMHMMTNGMFEPNVTEDSKLPTPIGPFTHILLYELRTPYFALCVMNLTAVIDGLAYILQVMCNGNEFGAVRKEVVEMAKTASIDHRPPPADFRTVSSITVAAPGGRASYPASWTVDKTATANPVFKLLTSSTSKQESIEIHNGLLGNAIDLTKPNATGTKTVLGATVTDYGTSLRVAIKNDAIVVCKPKHSGAIVTPHAVLAAIADSADFTATSTKEVYTYDSKALQLGFEVSPKARLIESRVSERILVYAPNGLPSDPSAATEAPMLTIRVGDPSNDPDCRTSYDDWLSRIAEETDGDTVSELKKDKINGRDCVTFMNKEMQEVGPGQREERTAKVVILLTGLRTTMLRWETPSGAWRKFEGKLNAVLDTLRLH